MLGGFLHNTVSELEHAFGRVEAANATIEIHDDVIMAFSGNQLILHASPQNVTRYILSRYGIEVIFTSEMLMALTTE